MRTILLKRISELQNGTFGVLIKDNGYPWLLTAERPWLNNQKSVSCIPAGTYVCKIADTPKHGKVYQLQGVPGRDAILIHVGNTEMDSEGCILIGRSFGIVNTLPGILQSKDGFKEFMEYLDGEDFTLRIVEVLNA